MSTPDRVWPGLDPVQADGLACVACGLLYTHSGMPHVPVGRSHTDSQVFACVGECAAVATDTSPDRSGGDAA